MKKNLFKKRNNELEEVLEKCESSAIEGYNIASSHYNHLRHALADAKTTVRDTLLEFTSSSVNADDTAVQLRKELSQIDDAFDQLVGSFKEDIENKRENLSRFSITLFGRTMVGKSTLMAILTDGNDEAIGQGAQRTTRDIRSYDWQGLHITDVPGIGAFEGAEDETIAFEAAKAGDIILFLITDDGPQAAEADFLARVISIGKPVIILMNIKEGISEDKKPERNLKKINKKFDQERLNDIKRQFLSYASFSGQNWDGLPFVSVHLKAARMAQREEDPQIANDYYLASRFGDLEKLILKTVKQKGAFYRKKSFIDTITVPMIDTMENLLQQSRINSLQGRLINDKLNQLKRWKEIFYKDGIKRIAIMESSIKTRLYLEIPTFAEAHLADRKADKAWNDIIDSYHVTNLCSELIDDLDAICIDRIKETSRQIEKELRFFTKISTEKSLRMKPIIDNKRIAGWGRNIIGGASTIVTLMAGLGIMTVSAPITVIFGGISILSFVPNFFKSRNKKEDEARLELQTKLNIHVKKVTNSLRSDMEKSFQSIISNRLDRLIKELERLNILVFQLADVQQNLAWELNKHILETNTTYITEALKYIGADGMQYHINETGRIPGSAIVIVMKEGTIFPSRELKDLKKLLPENLKIINQTYNKNEMIRKLTHTDENNDSLIIEKETGIAHLPGINDNSETAISARLAQQLTQIQITE